MKNFIQKVALVTGTSRPNGIGAAICRKLAQNGTDVFFTHWSSYDAATGYEDADTTWPEAFNEELKSHGIRSSHLEINLAEEDAAARLLNEVENVFGQPTILINNATYCVEVDFLQMTSGILDAHYAVNVRGTCMLSVEFAKRLQGKGGGRIVNLVSGQDKSPQPGNLAYVTTKGAISTFTKTLAAELAQHHITVNAIDPGPTDSGWMNNEIQEFLKPKFPMGRIGVPEDAARLIAFLVSDEARWITGQIIHSDGGFWD
ncbi:SDR family oxidoreductase [Falsibacillus albus]|uniref:SDR family oxidoreductase n=1 Tax=Falsibacillus albus TaxID=2478915 RepID=A0A3L7JTL9_9BACI|nr:SDR family oxidoreductase [Falsibacillus albus]RLQ94217.1 SDR family oxidoreductase [Falsibacillus albus]